MEGKLLVLCRERPTINENGKRIDENGNLLLKRDEKYLNTDEEEVEVDEHKIIINGMDLLNPMITESVEPSILYVDWETIIPSDIEPLYEMVEYAETVDRIPSKLILKAQDNRSLMKKAHLETLLQKDKYGERPCLDYRFQAMENFMQMFSDAILNNGIVSILPAYPNSEEEINRARFKVMEAIRYRMQMNVRNAKQAKVDMLDPFYYDEYGEVYIKAQREMMKIMSKPDWIGHGSPSDEDPMR